MRYDHLLRHESSGNGAGVELPRAVPILEQRMSDEQMTVRTAIAEPLLS